MLPRILTILLYIVCSLEFNTTTADSELLDSLDLELDEELEDSEDLEDELDDSLDDSDDSLLEDSEDSDESDDAELLLEDELDDSLDLLEDELLLDELLEAEDLLEDELLEDEDSSKFHPVLPPPSVLDGSVASISDPVLTLLVILAPVMTIPAGATIAPPTHVVLFQSPAV